MKQVFVFAAGLGYADLETRGLLRMAGLSFASAPSAFPAVTCTAQADFRTALTPRGHGRIANGWYSRELRKPSFWEQSARLVTGPRVWEGVRAAGERVGLYFFQQSLGETVDALISPAPIHKHGGGMIMRNYTKPSEMGERLQKTCGTFPLHRYWGPLASPRVGRAVLENFFAMQAAYPVDHAMVYLPTLDYESQRHGPASPQADRAMDEFRHQLERLADWTARQGAALTVCGDYAIEPVTRPPAFPNRTLRAAGLFAVRPVAGRAYPDFYASHAFAMCDHEIAHVYVDADVPGGVEKVAELFRATGEYASVEVRAAQDWAHPEAGEILLVAAAGSWCAYPWWTDGREAPDYATHIDIHNKPGYDPCELFFGRLFPPGTCQDATRIKGSHGRPSTVAWASTRTEVTSGDLPLLARALFAN